VRSTTNITKHRNDIQTISEKIVEERLQITSCISTFYTKKIAIQHKMYVGRLLDEKDPVVKIVNTRGLLRGGTPPRMAAGRHSQ
jgi:hypothetical protein